MIVQKEFLIKLKEDFKLNIYEVKIWTALLSRGMATAGELADISGVPRSRCYDVLESLEKKSFIIMKLGRPIKYIAVKPEEIVDRVKKNLKEESDIQLRIIESIQGTDIFKELELLHKTGIEKVDIEDISNSIVSRDELYRFLKNMVGRAKKSVVIATTKEGFIRKADLLKNILKKLDKKGVKIKILAPIDKKAAKKVDFAELKDVEPRARFVSIDNKELLFMITSDSVNPAYDSAIWVNSEFFAKALQGFFDSSFS